jgi:mannosyltransferase
VNGATSPSLDAAECSRKNVRAGQGLRGIRSGGSDGIGELSRVGGSGTSVEVGAPPSAAEGSPRRSWPSLEDSLPLLALTLLTAGLVLYRLDAKSLWLDEGFSAGMAGQDLRSVVAWAALSEPNHGLYYVLLHVVTLWGRSEWILRAFSAALVVGTVPGLFLLARRLFGRPVAVASTLLFGINALVVAFAQEARPYALALFLTTWCSLAFVRALAERSVGRWFSYVVLAVLAVHAHLFAAFVLVAHLGSLAFGHLERRDRRAAIVSFSAVAVLCLPLLGFMLRSGPGRIEWIDGPTLGGLMELFTDLVGRGGIALLLVYLCLLGLAAGPIRHTWRSTGSASTRWPYAFVLLWLLVPIALAVATSFVQPILVSRYLIVCVPALSMLAGIGLVHVPRRLGRIALAGLVIVLSGLALGTWYESEKEDWRRATGFVLSSARPGDGLVLHPGYLVWGFGHYVMRADGSAPRTPEPLSPPVRWTEGLPWSGPQDPFGRLFGAGERPSRVWLVLRPEGVDPLKVAERHRLLRILRDSYADAREFRFTGLRILLFADGSAARIA